MFEPLEKDIDKASKLFKARVGKFLNRKKENKKYYKEAAENKFGVHELIMYKEHNPSDLLKSTFSGPARIIYLQTTGAEIRDLRTSDKFFVTFDKLRKINFDEFLTILPKNYDSEINNKLKSYRYRRTDDDIPEITEKTSESSIGDFDIRHTRSGRVYNISTNMISKKYVNEGQNCTVKALENKKHESKNILRSCLKRSYDIRKIGMPDIPNVVPHYDITQLKQLDHFRTITKLKSYILGKISIDDPDTIGTTTSVLFWLFVILFFVRNNRMLYQMFQTLC